MNALVVYSHRLEGSFCSAMRDAAILGLRAAGHTVDVIDLAAEHSAYPYCLHIRVVMAVRAFCDHARVWQIHKRA